ERIAEVHEPGGLSGKSEESVTRFDYFFDSRTRVVSDPRFNVPPTIYTLNAYGATVRIEAPEGQIFTKVWSTQQTQFAGVFPNGGGKQGKDIVLVSQTDALGRTTSYKYDNLGNVIEAKTVFPSGMESVFDKNGTPVTDVTVNYTYDPLFNKPT